MKNYIEHTTLDSKLNILQTLQNSPIDRIIRDSAYFSYEEFKDVLLPFILKDKGLIKEISLKKNDIFNNSLIFYINKDNFNSIKLLLEELKKNDVSFNESFQTLEKHIKLFDTFYVNGDKNIETLKEIFKYSRALEKALNHYKGTNKEESFIDFSFMYILYDNITDKSLEDVYQSFSNTTNSLFDSIKQKFDEIYPSFLVEDMKYVAPIFMQSTLMMKHITKKLEFTSVKDVEDLLKSIDVYNFSNVYSTLQEKLKEDDTLRNAISDYMNQCSIESLIEFDSNRREISFYHLFDGKMYCNYISTHIDTLSQNELSFLLESVFCKTITPSLKESTFNEEVISKIIDKYFQENSDIKESFFIFLNKMVEENILPESLLLKVYPLIEKEMLKDLENKSSLLFDSNLRDERVSLLNYKLFETIKKYQSEDINPFPSNKDIYFIENLSKKYLKTSGELQLSFLKNVKNVSYETIRELNFKSKNTNICHPLIIKDIIELAAHPLIKEVINDYYFPRNLMMKDLNQFSYQELDILFTLLDKYPMFTLYVEESNDKEFVNYFSQYIKESNLQPQKLIQFLNAIDTFPEELKIMYSSVLSSVVNKMSQEEFIENFKYIKLKKETLEILKKHNKIDEVIIACFNNHSTENKDIKDAFIDLATKTTIDFNEHIPTLIKYNGLIGYLQKHISLDKLMEHCDKYPGDIEFINIDGDRFFNFHIFEAKNYESLSHPLIKHLFKEHIHTFTNVYNNHKFNDFLLYVSKMDKTSETYQYYHGLYKEYYETYLHKMTDENIKSSHPFLFLSVDEVIEIINKKPIEEFLFKGSKFDLLKLLTYSMGNEQNINQNGLKEYATHLSQEMVNGLLKLSSEQTNFNIIELKNYGERENLNHKDGKVLMNLMGYIENIEKLEPHSKNYVSGRIDIAPKNHTLYHKLQLSSYYYCVQNPSLYISTSSTNILKNPLKFSLGILQTPPKKIKDIDDERDKQTNYQIKTQEILVDSFKKLGILSKKDIPLIATKFMGDETITLKEKLMMMKDILFKNNCNNYSHFMYVDVNPLFSINEIEQLQTCGIEFPFVIDDFKKYHHIQFKTMGEQDAAYNLFNTTSFGNKKPIFNTLSMELFMETLDKAIEKLPDTKPLLNGIDNDKEFHVFKFYESPIKQPLEGKKLLEFETLLEKYSQVKKEFSYVDLNGNEKILNIHYFLDLMKEYQLSEEQQLTTIKKLAFAINVPLFLNTNPSLILDKLTFKEDAITKGLKELITKDFYSLVTLLTSLYNLTMKDSEEKEVLKEILRGTSTFGRNSIELLFEKFIKKFDNEWLDLKSMIMDGTCIKDKTVGNTYVNYFSNAIYMVHKLIIKDEENNIKPLTQFFENHINLFKELELPVEYVIALLAHIKLEPSNTENITLIVNTINELYDTNNLKYQLFLNVIKKEYNSNVMIFLEKNGAKIDNKFKFKEIPHQKTRDLEILDTKNKKITIKYNNATLDAINYQSLFLDAIKPLVESTKNGNTNYIMDFLYFSKDRGFESLIEEKLYQPLFELTNIIELKNYKEELTLLLTQREALKLKQNHAHKKDVVSINKELETLEKTIKEHETHYEDLEKKFNKEFLQYSKLAIKELSLLYNAFININDFKGEQSLLSYEPIEEKILNEYERLKYEFTQPLNESRYNELVHNVGLNKEVLFHIFGSNMLFINNSVLDKHLVGYKNVEKFDVKKYLQAKKYLMENIPTFNKNNKEEMEVLDYLIMMSSPLKTTSNEHINKNIQSIVSTFINYQKYRDTSFFTRQKNKIEEKAIERINEIMLDTTSFFNKKEIKEKLEDVPHFLTQILNFDPTVKEQLNFFLHRNANYIQQPINEGTVINDIIKIQTQFKELKNHFTLDWEYIRTLGIEKLGQINLSELNPDYRLFSGEVVDEIKENPFYPFLINKNKLIDVNFEEEKETFIKKYVRRLIDTCEDLGKTDFSFGEMHNISFENLYKNDVNIEMFSKSLIPLISYMEKNDMDVHQMFTYILTHFDKLEVNTSQFHKEDYIKDLITTIQQNQLNIDDETFRKVMAFLKMPSIAGLETMLENIVHGIHQKRMVEANPVSFSSKIIKEDENGEVYYHQTLQPSHVLTYFQGVKNCADSCLQLNGHARKLLRMMGEEDEVNGDKYSTDFTFELKEEAYRKPNIKEIIQELKELTYIYNVKLLENNNNVNHPELIALQSKIDDIVFDNFVTTTAGAVYVEKNTHVRVLDNTEVARFKSEDITHMESNLFKINAALQYDYGYLKLLKETLNTIKKGIDTNELFKNLNITLATNLGCGYTSEKVIKKLTHFDKKINGVENQDDVYTDARVQITIDSHPLIEKGDFNKFIKHFYEVFEINGKDKEKTISLLEKEINIKEKEILNQFFLLKENPFLLQTISIDLEKNPEKEIKLGLVIKTINEFNQTIPVFYFMEIEKTKALMYEYQNVDSLDNFFKTLEENGVSSENFYTIAFTFKSLNIESNINEELNTKRISKMITPMILEDKDYTKEELKNKLQSMGIDKKYSIIGDNLDLFSFLKEEKIKEVELKEETKQEIGDR